MQHNIFQSGLILSLTILFVIATIASAFTTAPSPLSQPRSRGSWLYVGGTGPGNYSSIQAAINAATSGNTVFVYNGTYYEAISIGKDLTVIGENKWTTIIDLQNTSADAVSIHADGVTIRGFTITHARNKETVIWNQSGIVIFSSNVTVTDNIISENRLGIMTYTTALNLTICDNMFVSDGFFPGCYLRLVNGMFEGTDSIPLACLSLTVTNNTVNGRPLAYLQNLHDTIIEDDPGQVILINCSNVTIRDLSLTKIDFSILLYYCTNCLVENVTIADTEGELILFFSENNIIRQNHITNAFHGICFDLGSKNNVACDNTICNSMQGITILTGCSGNRVYGNTLHRNQWAMKITSYTKNLPSHDNVVYENEFYKNKLGIILLTTFKDPLCYTSNNTVSNNTFMQNNIGVELHTSEGNVIEYNIFKRNLLSAFFVNCTQNYWNHNYWNHPRVLPKPIIGVRLMGALPVPCGLNFDLHPRGVLLWCVK